MADPAETSQRSVLYAEQSTFGTPALTTDNTAAYFRRTQWQGNHTKNKIESNEKRASGMKIFGAHGLNKTNPQLDEELYPGDSTPLWEGLLCRAFTAVSTITAVSGDGFSIASGVLVRAGASASWFADGLTIGTIFQIGASPQAANENRNVVVYGFTDSKHALVAPLSGAALVDSASDTDMTITIPGKRNYIPATGKLKKYFTVEDLRADVDNSQVYPDLMVNSLVITMAANQIVTLQWGFIGSGVVLDKKTTASPYFTSPVAPACGADGFSTARGILYMGGSKVTVLETLTITITWNAVAPEVSFSPTSPSVNRSNNVMVTFSGQALKDGSSIRDQFVGETKQAIVLALETVDGSAFSIVLGQGQIDSESIDDGDTILTESFDGEAYEACDIDGYDHTVIAVQDSTL